MSVLGSRHPSSTFLRQLVVFSVRVGEAPDSGYLLLSSFAPPCGQTKQLLFSAL